MKYICTKNEQILIFLDIPEPLLFKLMPGYTIGFFTDANTGYIAGGGIVKTYDGCDTWNLIEDFFSVNGRLYDIIFSSPTKGYAVGQCFYGPSGGFEGILYRTTNAGGTWSYHTISTLQETQI